MNGRIQLRQFAWALGLLVSLLGSLTPAAEPAMAQSPSLPSQAASAEDSYIFRTFDSSLRFENDGTGFGVDEAEIEIKSRSASQQLGQLYFPYTRGYTSLDVDFVRVIKPDGSVVDASPELIQDLPAPVASAFPIYSDLRILHVTVPSFEPGDTIRYRATTRIDKAVTPGQFSVIHSFQRAEPFRQQSLRIDVPGDRAVRLRTAAGLEPEVTESGERRVYSWTIRGGDLPEQDAEKIAMGRAESDLELSSFESWEQVGAWFRGLSEDRTEPDRAIREKAKALLANARSDAVADEAGSDERRIAALHRMVTTEIRYLGLLLGDAAYQPRPAQDVLASGFGDCKDKHVLLASLLRAAGFEASPVLVSHQIATPLDVPTHLHFDHVITHVRLPEEDLWLDATAIAPPGYLAPSLRGKQAVLVPADGETRVVTLPEDLPFEPVTTFETEGRIDPSGTLRSENVQRVRGDDEYLMRAVMLGMAPEQWREAIRQSLSQAGVEGSVGDVRASDAMDIASPLTFYYSMEHEGYLTGSGTVSKQLPFPRLELPDLEENEDGSLDLSALQQLDYRLTLEIPDGVDVEPPLPVEIDMELFAYRADYDYAASSNRLEVSRSLRWNVREIEASEQSRYEAFRRAVEKDVRQTVGFRLETPIGEDDPAVLRRSARAAAAAKDWQLASEAARKLTALSPDDAAGWELLARALGQTGDHAEAVAARNRVIEIDCYREGAYFNLGLDLERVDDDAGAIEAFRRQLTVDPLHEKARARLGLLLAESGECHEAVPYLARADDTARAYDWILWRLGVCLVELNRRDEAAEAVAKLAARSESEVIEAAAFDVMDRHAWPEAIRLFRRLLELEPEHEMAHNSLGWSLQHSGDLEGAEASYRRHVELHPTSDIAIWNLVNLFHQQGRHEDNVAVLERYLKHRPEDFHALKALGKVLFHDVKRHGAARGPMERAFALEPEDPEVNLVLGILASRAGRYEAAVGHLEVASKSYPQPFEYQDLLDYCREQVPTSGG